MSSKPLIPTLLRRSTHIAHNRTNFVYYLSQNALRQTRPSERHKVSAEQSRTVSSKARPDQAERRVVSSTKFTHSSQQRRKYSGTIIDRSAVMSTEESTFKTRDGTPLYTKTWKVSESISFSDHRFNSIHLIQLPIHATISQSN